MRLDCCEMVFFYVKIKFCTCFLDKHPFLRLIIFFSLCTRTQAVDESGMKKNKSRNTRKTRGKKYLKFKLEGVTFSGSRSVRNLVFLPTELSVPFSADVCTVSMPTVRLVPFKGVAPPRVLVANKLGCDELILVDEPLQRIRK